MNNPALTWRVRRVGQKLWTSVCTSGPMSWLSTATVRPESGARPGDAVPLERIGAERHWLTALRLPAPISTPDGDPAEPISP